MATKMYKAKDSYAKAKNTLERLAIHCHNDLLKGHSVVLSADLEGLPESLKEHLQEVPEKKPVKIEEAKEEVIKEETQIPKSKGGK